MHTIDLNGCFPTCQHLLCLCVQVMSEMQTRGTWYKLGMCAVQVLTQGHLVQTGHVCCAGANLSQALFGYF